MPTAFKPSKRIVDELLQLISPRERSWRRSMALDRRDSGKRRCIPQKRLWQRLSTASPQPSKIKPFSFTDGHEHPDNIIYPATIG